MFLKIEIQTPVEHSGRVLLPGSSVELPECEAQALIEVGAATLLQSDFNTREPVISLTVGANHV